MDLHGYEHVRRNRSHVLHYVRGVLHHVRGGHPVAPHHAHRGTGPGRGWYDDVIACGACWVFQQRSNGAGVIVYGECEARLGSAI